MRVNVDKVLERDQKLSELDDRAGTLYKLTSRSTAQLKFPRVNNPPIALANTGNCVVDGQMRCRRAPRNSRPQPGSSSASFGGRT